MKAKTLIGIGTGACLVTAGGCLVAAAATKDEEKKVERKHKAACAIGGAIGFVIAPLLYRLAASTACVITGSLCNLSSTIDAIYGLGGQKNN